MGGWSRSGCAKVLQWNSMEQDRENGGDSPCNHRQDRTPTPVSWHAHFLSQVINLRMGPRFHGIDLGVHLVFHAPQLLEEMKSPRFGIISARGLVLMLG